VRPAAGTVPIATQSLSVRDRNAFANAGDGAPPALTPDRNRIIVIFRPVTAVMRGRDPRIHGGGVGRRGLPGSGPATTAEVDDDK
jgi:hypothetical protein